MTGKAEIIIPSFTLFLSKSTETTGDTRSSVSSTGPFPQCCPGSLLKKITDRSKMLFLILKRCMSNKITFGYFVPDRKKGWFLKCFYGSCGRPQSYKHMTTDIRTKTKENCVLSCLCVIQTIQLKMGNGSQQKRHEWPTST